MESVHRCPCNCSSATGGVSQEEDIIPLTDLMPEDTLEQRVYNGFRLWHLMFMGFAGVMTIVICVCCCVRFRIPRTKQEIEADYVRKKITRKFQKQLRLIQNAEMDEMDLKRALERVRAEFRSETASLAASDGSAAADDSVFNNSAAAEPPAAAASGKRDDSKIEDENKHKGFGQRISSLVGFLRWRRGHQQQTQENPSKLGV